MFDTFDQWDSSFPSSLDALPIGLCRRTYLDAFFIVGRADSKQERRVFPQQSDSLPIFYQFLWMSCAQGSSYLPKFFWPDASLLGWTNILVLFSILFESCETILSCFVLYWDAACCRLSLHYRQSRNPILRVRRLRIIWGRWFSLCPSYRSQLVSRPLVEQCLDHGLFIHYVSDSFCPRPFGNKFPHHHSYRLGVSQPLLELSHTNCVITTPIGPGLW